MSIRSTTLGVANRILRPARLRLVSDWVWDTCALQPTKSAPTFHYGDRDYPYFSHHYNCGWPAAYATERTVELALADDWLTRTDATKVVEVGAVTPYYWPGRVSRIIDPADNHTQVTDRVPMNQIDLTGLDVLCVSTLEHFGKADYGLASDDSLLHAALEQLSAQARTLLATVPYGYNPVADSLFFGGCLPAGLRVGYLVRDIHHMTWRQTSASDARRPYTAEYAASGVAIVVK